MKAKIFFKCIIVSLVFFQAGLTFGAVKFYQSSKVHSNGSISITFTYSAKESDIKNNMIGSLPFAIEEVKKFFSSPVSEIKKSLVYKEPSDKSISSVTIDIDLRDINKITEISGLNNFKSGWLKSDSGMVFNWLIPASFMQTNLIDTYQFVIAFDGKIISTNGIIRDNTCNWYVFGNKINPGGAFFVTTVSATDFNKSNTTTSESVVKTENGKESDTISNSAGSNKSEDGVKQNEKPKGCGWFAYEFPLVLFSGLIISSAFRKIRIEK